MKILLEMASTRSVHILFAFLCIVSLVVPPVKNAPFGFDSWYEGDLLKSIACGLFDYCDDEDYEEDCQDTEEPTTFTATTTVTPNTTDPFFMKPLILESPTPPMTTPAIQNETR